jgi:hypothetical protein
MPGSMGCVMDTNTVNTWLVILTGALGAVTGYYAIVTHRILVSNRKMVNETSRMAGCWRPGRT